MMFKNISLCLLSILFIINTSVCAKASEVKTTALYPLPEINAEAAVLIDADTGAVIYDKNMNDRHFPASITKIMTCLLAIENSGENYEQRIPFSYNAVMTLPLGTSHIAMNDGETLTLEECLYGLMLESANDVANALAEYYADTNEKFAVLMTDKAQELGAAGTNFTNPHGLHDKTHYTTAYDMALITQAAIKEPEFIKMITTETLFLPPTERQPERRPLNNGHKMIHPGHRYYNEYVIGGKTGFTDEAGNTLVTYAQNGDVNLISVILKDASSDFAYEDTNTLLDYGFNTFDDVKIFNAALFSRTVSVVKPKEGGSQNSSTVDVYAENDVSMYLPDSIEPSDIREEIDLPHELTVPVNKDAPVGTLKLFYNDYELASVDLLAEDDVLDIADPVSSNTEDKTEGGILSLVLKIIGWLFAGLAVTVLIIRTLNAVKRKRHKERMKRRRERARKANVMYAENGNRNYRYRD